MLTEPTCEVQGLPWLYAVGDVAALEGPDWKAKQGHIAEVMARTAADDIERKVDGPRQAGSYVDEVCILCVMDMGNGAGFVYRDDKRALFIPMPIVGHWLKRAWGHVLPAAEAGQDPEAAGSVMQPTDWTVGLAGG